MIQKEDTENEVALEPRTSRNFQIGIISEGTAKFGASRVEMVKNVQQIPASSMQILAKFCACSITGCARFRHCTRQQLDAEILQRQDVFAATPAEVLVRCASTAQRICNEFASAFSGGKIAQWRRQTHDFLGAQHGADLHWSRGRLAIFKSE